MTQNRHRRDALLGELESIRSLLDEDRQDPDDLGLIADQASIPLLLPEADAVHHIPLLSAVAVDTSPLTEPGLPPFPAADPLAAIRQASAKVAARTAVTGTGVHDREKLVDEVVRAALPRLEQLLRDLVQDALLQDKLRNGRR